jgi:hypothetical protein
MTCFYSSPAKLIFVMNIYQPINDIDTIFWRLIEHIEVYRVKKLILLVTYEQCDNGNITGCSSYITYTLYLSVMRSVEMAY